MPPGAAVQPHFPSSGTRSHILLLEMCSKSLWSERQSGSWIHGEKPTHSPTNAYPSSTLCRTGAGGRDRNGHSLAFQSLSEWRRREAAPALTRCLMLLFDVWERRGPRGSQQWLPTGGPKPEEAMGAFEARVGTCQRQPWRSCVDQDGQPGCREGLSRKDMAGKEGRFVFRRIFLWNAHVPLLSTAAPELGMGASPKKPTASGKYPNSKTQFTHQTH